MKDSESAKQWHQTGTLSLVRLSLAAMASATARRLEGLGRQDTKQSNAAWYISSVESGEATTKTLDTQLHHDIKSLQTTHHITIHSGGFFLTCLDLGRMFDNSFPAYVFFLLLFLFSGGSVEHTNSTLYARISPQWLSKLRWLWLSIPW